jgi:hypothetical protein
LSTARMEMKIIRYSRRNRSVLLLAILIKLLLMVVASATPANLLDVLGVPTGIRC